ncbi:hypothetical protein [Vreelandella andesensis]|nr:hypothetical protein [Halomonas andesensis]
MTQAETITPSAQQWLRYWRNSLADAESGRGALTVLRWLTLRNRIAS